MIDHAVVRLLLLVIGVLVAATVGVITGVLARLSGQSTATAVRHGGVALGGTLTLAILVINFVAGW